MRLFVFCFTVACFAHLAMPFAGLAQSRVAVAWNDFGSNSGFIRAFGAAAPWDYVTDPLAVGLNPIIRHSEGRLYVISQDNMVRAVDTNAWEVDRTYPLLPGGEPLDIAVVNEETAYITRAGATHLLRLNLATGAMQEVIDLAPFADADGIPDLATMAVSDGRLFVQIQRLNLDDVPGYAPPAYLAVVDLATEQLIDVDSIEPGVQTIELSGTAAKHKMQVVPETRQLFVSATGAVFDEGGIEIIDLDTLESQGLVIHEADDLTGADLGPFVMVTPQDGFLAFTTDLTISSHLQAFSVGGGVDPDPLYTAVDYLAPTIAFDPQSHSIFFPVGRGVDNGVHVFHAATGEQLTLGRIPTSGPPTDLVLLPRVPEPGSAALVAMCGVALLMRIR